MDANIAFFVADAFNAFFFVMEEYVASEVWMAWQWYLLLGVIVTFVVGGLLSLRHGRPMDGRRNTTATVCLTVRGEAA